MIVTAEEENWYAPTLATENDLGETMREYESRRCHICRCHYPAFGFGPPLIRNGATIWACDTHRAEVDRMLGRGGVAPADKAQLTLL